MSVNIGWTRLEWEDLHRLPSVQRQVLVNSRHNGDYLRKLRIFEKEVNDRHVRSEQEKAMYLGNVLQVQQRSNGEANAVVACRARKNTEVTRWVAYFLRVR